jgi:hypothetical protein
VRNKCTYIYLLRREDPAALEKLIAETLREEVGSRTNSAGRMGISYPYFNWLLKQHGMTDLPRQERERAKRGIRLPPLTAA